MVEDYLEVFMDEFLVVGYSFDEYYANLDKVLARLYKAKIEVISKLSPPPRQRFDIDIQDKKGSENQVVNHLSRLEEDGRPHASVEINDSFPDEQLLALSKKKLP
ncbi:uncharacterized protein [Nicotiana tomentosiformis]|uniref:uncharacterized protein n=1 Tax=Nicotiana tomentosiformis TaxID=4098 RepID=UPI00388C7309